MDKYEQFYLHIQKAAEEFKKINGKETIRIISHLDADGLSSSSILIKAISRLNRQYTVSIVQKIDEQLAQSLSQETYTHIAFTDLGSGNIKLLKEHLKGKKIYIFDHHEPETTEHTENIIHVNPHMFGIDGSKEVSGAGVTYLFAKALDNTNKDMAHIAIVGAIGDIQENRGFEKVNSDILKDALESGKMKIIPGLKIFGAQTKPLHKLLAYSTEYKIGQVTGSESAAIQFLMQNGINPKKGEKWRKLVDLDDEEIKRLVTGIIMLRLTEKEPEAIIGPVYILREEAKQSPLRDAKEFATLLNACGRMDNASLGIGACIGDKKLKAKAIEHISSYKKELVKAMNWYEESTKTGKIITGRNYIIINAEDKIRHTMIGTIASILSKSNNITEGTLILSMARMDDGNTKISLRTTGQNTHDLRQLASQITEPVSGTSGGHAGAAGAVIKTEAEQKFIENARETFEKIS